MRQIIFAAMLIASASCAKMMNIHTDKYQHPGTDKATEPFQFAFEAPNGGYLFPFQDMVVEVVFHRDTMVDAYVYDKTGQQILLDDDMKNAGISVYPAGSPNHQFIVQMVRDGSVNSFRGKTTIPDLSWVDRSIALRFSFVLPDPDNNYTRRQCHEGHWSTATPRVQSKVVSSL
jgi:hypothetical protein